MSDCKSKKEAGQLVEGDCCLYMGKEYIIFNKRQYYVTGKSPCGHIMNFSMDTMVHYLGKGKVSFEFVDYEPIDEAAVSLSKYFNKSYVWIVIRDNELHVCYNELHVCYSPYLNVSFTVPDIWKGHPVKYVPCVHQVIKL